MPSQGREASTSIYLNISDIISASGNNEADTNVLREWGPHVNKGVTIMGVPLSTPLISEVEFFSFLLLLFLILLGPWAVQFNDASH